MKFKASAILAVAVLTLAGQAMAQSVGYNCIPVPNNSDTRVSVPFTSECIGEYAIDTSGVNGNTLTLDTTDDLSGLTSGLYYARVTDSANPALCGVWFTISATPASNEITLIEHYTGAAADLSTLAAGDTVMIFAHWTLATIFPDNLEGLTFASSPNGLFRTFEVLYTDRSSVGTNKAATFTFYYLASSNAWLRTGSLANQDSFVIPPQATLILRNRQTGTPATDDPETLKDEGTFDLAFYPLGECKDIKITECIPVEASDNDIFISAGNALPITLADTKLFQSGAFAASPNGLFRTDELLVYDNAAIGQNKSAQFTFYYLQGQGWRRTGSLVPQDDFLLTCGQAFIIRKDGGTPGDVKWLQD